MVAGPVSLPPAVAGVLRRAAAVAVPGVVDFRNDALPAEYVAAPANELVALRPGADVDGLEELDVGLVRVEGLRRRSVALGARRCTATLALELEVLLAQLGVVERLVGTAQVLGGLDASLLLGKGHCETERKGESSRLRVVVCVLL